MKTLLYSDFAPGNLLQIVLCRSYERGKFTAVTLDAELPAGYFFFTAKDLKKNKALIKDVEVPFLAAESVAYAGEAVAIIAGEDERVCRKLSERVKIDFVGDVQIPKYEERGISAISEREIGEGAERERIFAECENVAENTWRIMLDFQSIGEPTGAICQLALNAMIISTQSEDAAFIQNAVSSVVDKKIIVNKLHSPIQKSTNSIWYEAFCAALCALVSEYTDMNTKIVFSRKEQEKIVERSLESIIKSKIAVEADGAILASEIEIEADMGFMNPMANYVMDYLANTSFGVYNIPQFKIKATAYSSSNAPAGVNTHTISAEAFFALENQINAIGKTLNLFPDEIRAKNCIMQERDEQQNIIGAVLKKSDFRRKYVSYKLNAVRRGDPSAKKCLPFSTALRGIGLSTVSDGETAAAVVVELELDPCTFRERIRALHLVIDCGKVENVSAATNELKRDIHQISRILLKDDTIEIGEKSISFITSDRKPSHIGEIVFNAVPAAYTSALGQILSTQISTFPLDTESVYNLYQKNCVIERKRENYENIADAQRA